MLSSINARCLTLEQYLDQVGSANLTLKSSRSRSLAERERSSAAGTWDDPFFAIGVDEVPSGRNSEGVTRYQLSQTVPFPGRLGARKEAAISRAEAVAADLATDERQVILVAAQTFARAFYTKRAIASNRSIASDLENLAQSAKSRYTTGGSGHHEFLLAKAELASLKAENLRLGRESKTLQAALNEFRSEPLTTLIEVTAFKVTGSVPENFDDAMKTQPEMRATDSFARAATAERRSARLSYFPDFVVQGMYMEPRMKQEPAMEEGGSSAAMKGSTWGAMVGVSIPLYFFTKQNPRSSAASADLDAAVASQRALRNRLSREWLEASEQLATAQDLVKLYEQEILPATDLAAKNGRAQYIAKRLPLSQYIEALRIRRTQELEFAAAEIDLELAKLRKLYLLSNAPIMRIAPTRPTLFGGMAGGMDNEMASGSVNMGSGMTRQPVKQKGSSPTGAGSSSSGMEGM